MYIFFSSSTSSSHEHSTLKIVFRLLLFIARQSSYVLISSYYLGYPRKFSSVSISLLGYIRLCLGKGMRKLKLPLQQLKYTNSPADSIQLNMLPHGGLAHAKTTHLAQELPKIYLTECTEVWQALLLVFSALLVFCKVSEQAQIMLGLVLAF